MTSSNFKRMEIRDSVCLIKRYQLDMEEKFPFDTSVLKNKHIFGNG